ncbi:4Fe-4S dicluster domain-containing protein [Ruminococcus sp. OM08-7]|nr:4Fe-4S dicluster domain-containing protein [Ruminococcus sp. TM10-9AT]RHU86426.1 4Fe-4S dicluster domain-containing protein [Ruminococcus sp. OM08-7]
MRLMWRCFSAKLRKAKDFWRLVSEVNMKGKCSGCSACAVACPKTHCIKMEYNEYGFLRPITNEIECIHCGRCEKVCPMETSCMISLDDSELYSAWGEADDRQASSSGGIAAVLSRYAITHGYEVCGAVMDYDTLTVKHRIVNDKNGLKLIRGSKYLQSDVTEAFSETLKNLKAFPHKKYMIFGTPCQISGFRNVLKLHGLIDRVILIDIFCHGVPSKYLWTKYLKWIKNKMKFKSVKNIEQITFRDKKYSWHTYYMNISVGGALPMLTVGNTTPF